jgi:hypothetical protein
MEEESVEKGSFWGLKRPFLPWKLTFKENGCEMARANWSGVVIFGVRLCFLTFQKSEIIGHSSWLIGHNNMAI